MALKADRNELDVDISFFMNVTAERGKIVCISTVGSGAAMDQAGALVDLQIAHASEAIPMMVAQLAILLRPLKLQTASKTL